MSCIKNESVRHTNKFGDIFWLKFGTNVLHRTDGPAIENYNGDKEYWLEGYRYDYSDWLIVINPHLKAFV